MERAAGHVRANSRSTGSASSLWFHASWVTQKRVAHAPSSATTSSVRLSGGGLVWSWKKKKANLRAGQQPMSIRQTSIVSAPSQSACCASLHSEWLGEPQLRWASE